MEDSQDPGAISLVTSVPPRSQSDAVKVFEAWNALGIQLFTANGECEARELTDPCFNERILRTTSDLRHLYERPLVSVNEALAELGKILPEGSIIGVVNADIFPFRYFPWKDYANSISDDELHIFKRTDYEKSGLEGSEPLFSPSVYQYGYDLFLVRNTEKLRLALQDNTGNLAFAVPWWDYWFPMKLINAGFKVLSVETCAIFHQRHPENFSQALWNAKGVEFSDYFRRSVGNAEPDVDEDEHQRLIKLCDIATDFLDTQKYLSIEMPELPEGISILSACMNRNENLSKALSSWIACPEVSEIVIVDWSSREPVRVTCDRLGLSDSRIKIIREESAKRWNLCKAYNLGFKRLGFDKVLKLDADVEITDDFFAKHKLESGIYFSGSWRGASNDNERRLNGSFFGWTREVHLIGGYNEVLDSYGWDDSDLYRRLLRFSSHHLFDLSAIRHLEQSDESRLENNLSKERQLGLPPAVITELEIRKNEWKAFFSLPKLLVDSKPSDFATAELNDLYARLAIASEITKDYDWGGLSLSRSFVDELTLDALESLFILRQSDMCPATTLSDLFNRLAEVPFLPVDLGKFASHVESPCFSSDWKSPSCPGVVKTEDLYGKHEEDHRPLFGRSDKDLIPHDPKYFYIDRTSLRSRNFDVTVPIVVFDGARFIDGLLRDIRNQTHFDHSFFVFVIADRQDYAQIEHFCEVFSLNTLVCRLTHDPGLYGCWNFVARSTKSRYMSNWNVDDRRDPTHLQKCIEFLDCNDEFSAVSAGLFVNSSSTASFEESSKIGFESKWFVGANFSFDHRHMFQRQSWLPTSDPERERIVSRNFLHCMPVWRSKLHKANGFFDESRYGASADWEFWLRCGVNGARFFLIGEALGAYFLNPDSYGRTAPGVIEKEEEIFKKYLGYYEEDKSVD